MVNAYLAWLKEHHLKPVWLNLNQATEKILAEELGWRALSVTADQRIDLSDPAATGNKGVQRKIHAAQKGGMTVQMIKGEVSAELRAEIDGRIEDWKNSREGTQIHTTKVRPWADCRHRAYFIAREKSGRVSDANLIALEHSLTAVLRLAVSSRLRNSRPIMGIRSNGRLHSQILPLERPSSYSTL